MTGHARKVSPAPAPATGASPTVAERIRTTVRGSRGKIAACVTVESCVMPAC
jgi:hypothetical protein